MKQELRGKFHLAEVSLSSIWKFLHCFYFGNKFRSTRSPEIDHRVCFKDPNPVWLDGSIGTKKNFLILKFDRPPRSDLRPEWSPLLVGFELTTARTHYHRLIPLVSLHWVWNWNFWPLASFLAPHHGDAKMTQPIATLMPLWSNSGILEATSHHYNSQGHNSGKC